LQHAVAVERPGRRHRDLAGDHRLHEPAVAHGTAGGLDRVQVHRRRRHLIDLVRVGCRQRRRRRGEGLVRVVVSACRQPFAGDLGHPALALTRLGDDDTRDDDLAGLARLERDPAEPDRAATGGWRFEAGLIGVVDRREHGRGVVERHPQRDAAAGEPDSVAHEQESVSAGDVVEVEPPDGVVGETRDRLHPVTLTWPTIRRPGCVCR
jgi:hypothetical protein